MIAVEQQVESVGKYHRYGQYVSSGYAYLPEVPEHWEILRNRQLFHFKKRPVGKRANQYQLLSLTLKGIIPRDIESGKGKIPAEFDTYQVVEPHNIVFCLFDIDETPRTVGLSSQKGMVTGAYAVAEIAKEHCPEFVYYYYLHLDEFKGLRPFYTGLRKVVRPETFMGLRVPTPPQEEQRTIAAFLDYETARIDRLIAQQQRLIELLKEKRQAVISHAVTKGLNPNAPMKDSGIEWLGQVPEHWATLKFNHCASIRNGQVDPTISPYNDHILIAPNHIESGTGRILYMQTAEEQGADSGKYICKKGEVIYSKIRPALVKVCLSPENHVICSADMYPICGRNGLENDFLLWFLLSDNFTRFAVNQADRVAMPKINRDSLSESRIPVPPKKEQVEIVSFLNRKTGMLDTLIEKSVKAITLMQERRTALISAAVTGKIDLRGWTPPAEEVAA